MRRARTWILVVLPVLTAVSCVGSTFVRPETESLRLGETTSNEILSRFGAPQRQGTQITNENTLNTIIYTYTSLLGAPFVKGITPERTMVFFFMNDRLVGHLFTSSFKGDHTDFDEERIKTIKKGETTRAQVIQLLGPPAGLYVFPLIKKEGDRGIAYKYSQARPKSYPNEQRFTKYLLVTVDGNGVVTDVWFNSSGQR